jgi:trimethylamine--corrinoid protein Co-methyltransferase
MTEVVPESGRRTRRDTQRRSTSSAVQQVPKHISRRPFAPVNLVSADELESIHRASLRVLSEIGMDFMLPEARDLLKKAGAKIVGERVYFEPAMIEELIAHAP